MCRNINTLFNLEPAATEDEICAAEFQFVRKLSGFHQLSKANKAAFYAAVDAIASDAGDLLHSLETRMMPKDRVLTPRLYHSMATLRRPSPR